MAGPLGGVVVIEFGSIGPCPLAGMLLADLGADVIRIDRTSSGGSDALASANSEVHNRGKRSVLIDVKTPEGREAVLRLSEKADVLIEGFRPGVMERLGLGPDDCFARNPSLVYGRTTGWGQDGPYANLPGHDVNFIGLSGALDAFGRKDEPPVPPLNLVGDFGGGSMFLIMGALCALIHVRAGGSGQVIDASMVEGSALLMSQFYGTVASGVWQVERGTNDLDTGSHYYEVYATADGRHMAVGAAEPQFYAELVQRLGLGGELPPQTDRASWPEMKQRFTEAFASRTQDEWCTIFDGTQTCVTPVLPLTEAPKHPHNVARESFVELDGVVQPAPAPRLSATPAVIRWSSPRPGEHTDEVLQELGYSDAERDELRRLGAVAAAR
jgi:alpha-methylacyl-CoA racemase